MDDDFPTVADGWRWSGKTIAFGVIVLVTVVVLGGMAVFGVGWFKRGTADFRGETEQRELTNADGAYRIAAYEHFYDLCAAVQSKESAANALKTELETGPRESRVDQINASLAAITASRAELINEYNADARKEATAAQFKASDLPSKLNEDDEKTECEA